MMTIRYKSGFRVGALCLIALFLGACRAESIGGRGTHLLGKPAPQFTGSAVNGGFISLSDYRGKVVLLDFWATWCRPCLWEMPAVKKFYDRFRGDDFALIGISLDQSRASLEKYIRDNGLGWPSVFDGKGWRNRVAVQYGVSAIPFTVLIDRQGVVRQVGLRGPALERAIAEMLAAPLVPRAVGK